MRVMLTAVVAVLVLAGPALAQSQNSPNQGSQITCSQIDDAQHFVDGLRPGPNTRAAQKHLEAAKAAPGPEHRLLQRVLSVVHRTEDPVAVELDLAPVRLR